MDKFLTFTVVGLSTSAIYAIAASGLVVTYTTSGIFNFAHGAIGMMAAFTYWQVHVSSPPSPSFSSLDKQFITLFSLSNQPLSLSLSLFLRRVCLYLM